MNGFILIPIIISIDRLYSDPILAIENNLIKNKYVYKLFEAA